MSKIAGPDSGAYPFNLGANPSDNPLDLLSEIRSVLFFLRFAVEEENVMDARQAREGLGNLLDGVVETVRSIEQLVSRQITEPFAEGYRKGLSDGRSQGKSP